MVCSCQEFEVVEHVRSTFRKRRLVVDFHWEPIRPNRHGQRT